MWPVAAAQRPWGRIPGGLSGHLVDKLLTLVRPLPLLGLSYLYLRSGTANGSRSAQLLRGLT